MNRFSIVSCVNLEKAENGYCGPAIALGCVTDPSLVLFFPITAEKADILNYLIKDGDYGINTEVIGLYKTMIDSWTSSNQFLSGIILDCTYDQELNDDIMDVTLSLSNSTSGLLESVVHVNFVNSMILAAMRDIEVIVTMKLLNKLLPEENEENEDENGELFSQLGDSMVNKFPEDGKILDIVKGIMNGNFFNSETNGDKPNSPKPLEPKPSDPVKSTKKPSDSNNSVSKSKSRSDKNSSNGSNGDDNRKS